MSERQPTVQTADAPSLKPEPSEAEKARAAFIKARKGRNRMIALGLVAFAVLLFTITALRLMQNIADRVPG